MSNLLHIIPIVVVLFEYIAVSSAVAYARYAIEWETIEVSLIGGLIRVGGNLPFDAVPNTVLTLHLLSLVLSLVYFIYFVIFGTSSRKESEQPVPPQEG